MGGREHGSANWQTDASSGEAWSPAMQLGRWAWRPGDIELAPSAADLYPDLAIASRLYEKWGVPADFEFQTHRSARTALHPRRIGETDVYFVSNRSHATEALCSSRLRSGPNSVPETESRGPGVRCGQDGLSGCRCALVERVGVRGVPVGPQG